MIDVEKDLQDFPIIDCKSGTQILVQGEQTDTLYFLLEGAVKISRDGYEIAARSEQGAVLGEMSILLQSGNSASVECITDSRFYRIKQPQNYLQSHPQIIWHIAEILSMRLCNLTQYLVDVKRQYEGHDHLSMVDDVLESLLNQQSSKQQKRGGSKRDNPGY